MSPDLGTTHRTPTARSNWQGPPMNHTIDRSVWGTSTDTFKHHYREYLNALAELDD